jgi:hypothetical protein
MVVYQQQSTRHDGEVLARSWLRGGREQGVDLAALAWLAVDGQAALQCGGPLLHAGHAALAGFGRGLGGHEATAIVLDRQGRPGGVRCRRISKLRALAWRSTLVTASWVMRKAAMETSSLMPPRRWWQSRLQ